MVKNRKRQRGSKNRKRQRGGGGVQKTGGNFLNEFTKAASLLRQKAKNKFIQVKTYGKKKLGIRQKGGIIRRRRNPMGYNLWKHGLEVYNMY